MGIQATDRRMVRTLRGNARAFLSDRFRRLDHEDVAERILPMLEETGFKIRSVAVTDSRFYMHVISPNLEGEIRVGDPVRMGWIIGNSEIGMGSFYMQPLLERLRCTNGMVVSEYGTKKAHLGMRLGGDGDDYLITVGDDTRKAADDALWFGVRDHVKAMTSQDGLAKILSTLRERADDAVTGDPEMVVEELGNKFGLLEPEKKSILYSYLGEKDMSRWGLSNAITQLANTHESYDRAVEMEQRGGDLMAMTGKDWTSIATAH